MPRKPGEPGTRTWKSAINKAQWGRTAGAVQSALRTQLYQRSDGQIVKLEDEMSFFGPPAEAIDPGESVLEELARSRGYIRDLEAKVRDLEEEELVWQKVAETTERRSGGPGGGYDLVREEIKAQINTWWDMLERERKHYASVANAAVRSGLEERRVRLKERETDVLEAAMMLAIADLGHDPHDSRVRQVIGARLRQAIEGSTVIEGAVGASERAVEPVLVTSERPDSPQVPKPVDF